MASSDNQSIAYSSTRQLVSQTTSTQFDMGDHQLAAAVQAVPFDSISDSSYVRLNDNRIALWRTPAFKERLRSVLNQDKQNKEISNRYAGRVYKQMYAANVRNADHIKLYQKAMIHPECSRADYHYIEDKIKLINRNVSISILLISTSFAFAAVRFNGIQKVASNLPFYLPIIGLSPFTAMLLARQGTEYYINNHLKQLGIYKNYELEQNDKRQPNSHKQQK